MAFTCRACLHPGSQGDWDRHKFDRDMGVSEGPCECCGRLSACVDTPHSHPGVECAVRRTSAEPSTPTHPPEIVLRDALVQAGFNVELDAAGRACWEDGTPVWARQAAAVWGPRDDGGTSRLGVKGRHFHNEAAVAAYVLTVLVWPRQRIAAQDGRHVDEPI